MRYLCRLVTPKGGNILDPFAGSGTTGAVAFKNKRDTILIEKDFEYFGQIAMNLGSLDFLGKVYI